jgi:hypothetical protein
MTRAERCTTHHNACDCHMAVYRELLKAAKAMGSAVTIRLREAIRKAEAIMPKESEDQ